MTEFDILESYDNLCERTKRLVQYVVGQDPDIEEILALKRVSHEGHDYIAVHYIGKTRRNPENDVFQMFGQYTSHTLIPVDWFQKGSLQHVPNRSGFSSEYLIENGEYDPNKLEPKKQYDYLPTDFCDIARSAFTEKEEKIQIENKKAEQGLLGI